MIKYVYLVVVTMASLLIRNVVCGVVLYLAGLAVYEIWAILSLRNRNKNEIYINTNLDS